MQAAKNNKRKVTAGSCQIHGHDLEQVKKPRVTLDEKMSWKHHIAAVTVEAQTCRHFLQRNMTTTNKERKLQCYKIFVRPNCPESLFWKAVLPS